MLGQPRRTISDRNRYISHRQNLTGYCCRRWQGEIRPYALVDAKIKDESRFIRLSLTWNIGNSTLKKNRKKESLVGDEQNRLKKGRG